jgi:hypothetical protein
VRECGESDHSCKWYPGSPGKHLGHLYVCHTDTVRLQMRQTVFVLALFLFMAAVPSGIAQIPKELKVLSNQGSPKLPLVKALRVIGLHLKGGFVSFGVDISGETEPEVDINMPDTPLADALQRITSQIPGYTSEFISEHVVEIYAAKERADRDDPLNLPVREFSVKDVPAFMILSLPTRYIPELKVYLSKDHKVHSELACGSIGPGLGSFTPGVTLSLTGRTVRQILDEVSEADAVLPASSSPSNIRMYPAGWVHRRKNDAKLGVVDTWSSMSFAPHDWKQYMAK